MWLVSALLGALGSADALGAEVTEMPPKLGIVASLEYSGSSLSGGLVEEGERVGERRIVRHDVDLGAEFGIAEGFAATLDLAVTPSLRYRYPESRTMIIEPLTGSGSYLSGDVVGERTVRASGLDGIWLGVAAAPFSEAYGPDQRVTWRLDAGFRTPSKKRNLWTAPNGTRGAAEGGSALRLAGAFSTHRGITSPWLRAEWIREGKVEVEVTDEDGVTWSNGLALRPASTFATDLGVELTAWEDPATESRASVELWLGAGYRTWEDVATGVYLPNVLDGARTIPVTVGDTVTARAGTGVDLELQGVARIRTGLVFDYAVPYRLEHVYDVKTSADTFRIGWSIAFAGIGRFASPEPEPLD